MNKRTQTVTKSKRTKGSGFHLRPEHIPCTVCRTILRWEDVTQGTSLFLSLRGNSLIRLGSKESDY